MLLKLDDGPFAAVNRMAFGFLILPATQWILGSNPPGWSLVAVLLAALFLLRLVPAVLRKLMPISDKVRSVWWTRRQLAKRYDCYQWQKLFWIGLGLTLSAATASQFNSVLVSVCALSLLGGAIGIVRWNRLLRSGVVNKSA